MAGELSRRDFIQRTAYAAGLAGCGGRACLHAAERGGCGRGARVPASLAAQRNVETDHFVVLMLENRVVRPLLRLTVRRGGRRTASGWAR